MRNNGREFDLWVNSKAPMDKFGNISKVGVSEVLGDNSVGDFVKSKVGNDGTYYHGDGNDAKFTPNETDSSRLFMYMHIDTKEGTVSNVAGGSFGTENLKTHEHSMAHPIVGAKMQKGTAENASSVLRFAYSGGNPDKDLDKQIVPGMSASTVHVAPDIDIQGRLVFSEDKNGDLLIQGKVHGDGFPATSMFAHFDTTKVMIANAPIPKGATVFDLEGGATTEIMHPNLSIHFKDNTPVGVKDWNTMKEYSIEDWNTLHRTTPMIESEHSHDKIIDKGREISSLEMQKEFASSNSAVEINLNEEVQTDTQTTKAQEILASLNLNDFSKANDNDYGMEID